MTRILIVEDDSNQARVLARAFSKRRPDFTVLLTSNGLEATRLMDEQEIDLVLTDLQMPEMDGFELVAWMLSNRPSVPVFTMTAFGNDETVGRLSGLGSVECFTKPINVQSVLTRLTDTLSQTIRGHVQNVSLASFLQLVEMERKTCTLTVECGDRRGTLYIRRGQLVDAETADIGGEAAAVAIIAWPFPEITIMSHCGPREHVIDTPLAFVVMEAMRIQDETGRDAPVGTDGGSEWPAPRKTLFPIALPPPAPAPALDFLGPKGAELSVGVYGVAIVDAATGAVRSGQALPSCPLVELAWMAAFAVRMELSVLGSSGEPSSFEELVLSTRGVCELVRPCDPGARELGLLVFRADETNLVMAQLELSRLLSDLHRTP